jgi:hypothetical protein
MPRQRRCADVPFGAALAVKQGLLCGAGGCTTFQPFHGSRVEDGMTIPFHPCRAAAPVPVKYVV